MMTLNTAEFQSFKAKRQTWIEQLSDNSGPSINNQIVRMIWDAAAYRMINEARKYAKQTEDSVELNSMVHSLINRNFFASQAMAIRRLMDRRRKVISLYRLLGDMQTNRCLWTREHVFTAEGLLYDYGEIQKAAFAYGEQQARAGEGAWFVPEHLNWHKHENRHQHIDKLSGTTHDQRAHGDTVRNKVFSRLKGKLGVCDSIVTHVNNFIAHAAAPGSETKVTADSVSVTLGHLWDAHEAICKVASFVSIWLLGGPSHSPLATPQFNQFKYMDRPLITEENIPQLADTWQEYDRETHKWTLWGPDELEAEMQ